MKKLNPFRFNPSRFLLLSDIVCMNQGHEKLCDPESVVYRMPCDIKKAIYVAQMRSISSKYDLTIK